MPAKKGLGKGLDSLIPSKESLEKEEKQAIAEQKVDNVVTMVSIHEVEPNKKQPRKSFNEDALYELKESIKQHGVVQPILVSKERDYYEIIAGERRWRASRLAGLNEIPVIIKNYSPQEKVEVSLIENIQREDLNPVEEANAFQTLINEYHLKQDEVAERVSKSRTAVTNSLRLLKLDERVQQMLIEEIITSGHARPLLALEDGDKQFEVATRIIDEKLNVRDTEKLVKRLNSDPQPLKEKKYLDNEVIYKDLEEKLKGRIGTKVAIKRKDNDKGKIEIEYYSKKELDNIVNQLLAMEASLPMS